MREKITVFVDDRPVDIFRGMSVKHALISYDMAVYRAAVSGDVFIEDRDGFRVGLDGALQDGSRLYVKPVLPQ